jgi:hypothetical protein
VYFGTWEADDETPPLLCLNSNPTFEPSGTVLSGQFDWGDLLPKGNPGVALLVSNDEASNLAICWNIRVSRATNSRKRTGHNASGADNQQERPGVQAWNPQRLYAKHLALIPQPDDDRVRAVWRHTETGRNARFLAQCKLSESNKSRTEECKGTLSPVGNRASSVKV